MFSTEHIPLENKLKQLDDIMTHMEYIIKAGHKLCIKLMEKGEEKKSLKLMRFIMAHDKSKSTNEEFYGMAAYANDTEAMTNFKVMYPNTKKMDAITMHWMNNPHHPECWSNIPVNEISMEDGSEPLIITEMTEMFIMEMCCDWYARSMQFKTNPLDFFNMKNGKRWKFTDEISSMIVKYLNMLME